MKLTRLIFGTALVGGAAHLAAKGIADKLQRNPDPWQLSELLYPTPGDDVVVERDDGTRIHTKVAGTGPTVVFAHGYGLNLSEWNLIAERLVAAGRRVITFDQRGHGRSTIGDEGLGSPQMAGDYAAVLEHHDVRDGVLVGHSMGTFLALKLLLHHPDLARDRLKGVVLVAPLEGKANEGAPQNQLQIPLIKSGLFDGILRNPIYGSLMAATLFGSPAPSMVEGFRTVFLEQNHARLVAALDMLVHEDLGPRLAEIEMPVSVICGTKDRTTPTHHSRRIADSIDGADLTWVPGAGHALNWEAVDEVIDLIEKRLAG